MWVIKSKIFLAEGSLHTHTGCRLKEPGCVLFDKKEYDVIYSFNNQSLIKKEMRYSQGAKMYVKISLVKIAPF